MKLLCLPISAALLLASSAPSNGAELHVSPTDDEIDRFSLRSREAGLGYEILDRKQEPDTRQ